MWSAERVRLIFRRLIDTSPVVRSESLVRDGCAMVEAYSAQWDIVGHSGTPLSHDILTQILCNNSIPDEDI